MGYQFQQFDPRPIPAANQKNDAVFELGSVLGIEVTIPALAGRCDMGNIDHHGEGDTSETPSAIEQALAAKLPADGTVLATVRCDADSVGAMAVLANRVAGRYVDTDLVAAIGRFDRLGPAGGDVPDAVVAIARKSAAPRSPSGSSGSASSSPARTRPTRSRRSSPPATPSSRPPQWRRR